MSFAEELFSPKTVSSTVKKELDARADKKFQKGMSGQKTWCHIMSMAQGNAGIISTYSTFSQAYPTANRPNILVQNLDVNGTARINSTLSLTSSTYAGTFNFFLAAANTMQASSANIGTWLQVGGGNRDARA